MMGIVGGRGGWGILPPTTENSKSVRAPRGNHKKHTHVAMTMTTTKTKRTIIARAREEGSPAKNAPRNPEVSKPVHKG